MAAAAPSLSRPQTPPSHVPALEDYRFDLHVTPCESGESYHPGGYHSVEIGDVLIDRYEVIRKLGYGSYSTVWLAVDRQLNAYAALKVMISGVDQGKVQAELSLYQELATAAQDNEAVSYFLGLEHHFGQTGPNGRHTCLVFRPMGPHLSQFIRGSPQFLQGDVLDDLYVLPLGVAKRVLREVLLGLQQLHRNGVAHGDLHPGKILMNLTTQELESTQASRLRQNPEKDGDFIKRLDGKKDLWAPSYLIAGENLRDFTSVNLHPLIEIADLGAAFSVRNNCTKTVTPTHRRSPECILGLELGLAVDVWSFGCLIYELITGKDLFRVVPLEGSKYDEETNEEHLIQISEVLSSRLPEKFLDAWYRGPYYVDANGDRLKPTTSPKPLIEEGSPKKETLHEEFFKSVVESQEAGDGYREDLGNGFDEGSGVSDSPVPLVDPEPCQPLEALLERDKPPRLDDEQKNEILRLLRWVLEIDPEKRPGVDEILQDPWFQI